MKTKKILTKILDELWPYCKYKLSIEEPIRQEKSTIEELKEKVERINDDLYEYPFLHLCELEETKYLKMSKLKKINERLDSLEEEIKLILDTLKVKVKDIPERPKTKILVKKDNT